MKKIIDEINAFHDRIKEWFKEPIIINLSEKWHDDNKNNNMESVNNNINACNKQNVRSRNKKKS
jgi:hypothetical protein